MKNSTQLSQLFDYDVANPAELSSEFSRDGYVILRGLLPPGNFERLAAQIAILEAEHQRRNLQVNITGNTWRKMWVANGIAITEKTPVLAGLCRDEGLRAFLSGIAGEDVYLMNDELEYAVCNFLTDKGDVHGAHFDEFPYAFSIYFDVPQPAQGGQLIIAPGITEISQFDTAKQIRLGIKDGDCVFMKSGAIAHGVTPLRSNGRRIVFNVAFVNEATRDIISSTRGIIYGYGEVA